jgi:hypothetical protein
MDISGLAPFTKTALTFKFRVTVGELVKFLPSLITTGDVAAEQNGTPKLKTNVDKPINNTIDRARESRILECKTNTPQ